MHLLHGCAVWMFARLVCALACCACGAGIASAQAKPAAKPKAPAKVAPTVREQTADQQVKQAISRLTFGARPGDIAHVMSIGVDKWIAMELEPEKIVDTATENYLNRSFPQLKRSIRDLSDSMPDRPAFAKTVRKRDGVPDSVKNWVMPTKDSIAWSKMATRAFAIAAEITPSMIIRDQLSERQLLEVMVRFWENHFYIFRGRTTGRYALLAYDRDVIRPHALGKFRDLLQAVATSPQMMVYLDNYLSAADSTHATLAELKSPTPKGKPKPRRTRAGLNENYGRELMELHTLGVDGGYTQADVINVARALTGWSADSVVAWGGVFAFHPEWHDAEPKVVLGHKLAGGRGIEDGEDVLDILARQPSTATFIATKLVRHFVQDSVPQSLVTRVAATFTQTDGDIRECLRTIFTSPEFFSRQAYRGKLKTPFELVVSTQRAMDGLPDTTTHIQIVISRLGEPPFGHVTPDGYPDMADAWINTGALVNRINFGWIVGTDQIPGITLARWPPGALLRSRPFDEQVDGVIAELLGGEASPETRRILISGQNAFAAAAPPEPESLAVAAAIKAPPATPTQPSFSDLVGLALGAPEFQRR